ncbi:MAG: hypothetical protein QXP36_10205 [Conexivisphaerales archaeon]
MTKLEIQVKELFDLREQIKELEKKVKQYESDISLYLKKKELTSIEVDSFKVSLVEVTRLQPDFSLIDKAKLPKKEVSYSFIKVEKIT